MRVKYATRPRNTMTPPLTKFIHDLANSSLSDIADREFVSTRPSVNILEREKAFEIRLAAPGLSRDAFTIQVEDGVITISADATKPDSKYNRQEFDYTHFKRSFKVGDQVNSEGISAKYEQGILIVSLPKRSREEMRTKISVK